jgi:gamma-glutamyltranspeptidase / glutathione hydrolase
VFLPEGEVPELGATIVRLPGWPQTHGAAGARRAHAGFYGGETAALLVEAVRAHGGIWTLEDLAGYRIIEREPLVAEFGGVRIVAAAAAVGGRRGPDPGAEPPGALGPWRSSTGPTGRTSSSRPCGAHSATVATSAIRTSSTCPWSACCTRSTRTACAPRSAWTGRRPSAVFASPLVRGGRRRAHQHFSVIDADGNRVAVTQSLNFWYGSGFVVPGTGPAAEQRDGRLLRQAGQPNLFQLVGAEANAIAPGKRMLSSMTPTFLESPRGVAILGTPGGSRIISMVLLATLAWMEGADADAMVALPRYHHQYLPDRVMHEPDAFTPAECAALEARGHEHGE